VIARPGNTVVATIPVGNGPTGVAITPDGTQAYVANAVDNTVSVIHTATNTVAGLPIPVGSYPNWVAITPDGTQAYVTNRNSNTVSVIKTANRAVMATIPVGNFPTGVAITPDGTRAYVANFTSSPTPIPSIVSVIATASNTVVATVTMDRPFAVAVSPNGQDVYVSKLDGTNKVRVIATATNTKVAAIPVGHSPMGVAIGP
jgi:YVTN family beta-propeller protein